ncbi:MAG: GTP cyclohydrolase I [bacterium]|nr:GTP cyclohydrolase I [bacterium]
MSDLNKSRITAAAKELLAGCGIADDDDLSATPARVAGFYSEFFQHLHEPPPNLPLYPVTRARSETIALHGIPFYSLCSHHLLPFFGTISVAYQPNTDWVLGFSGVVHIVNYYANRPTLQETLATAVVNDIAQRFLKTNPEAPPPFVYAEVNARQLCMEMRGVRTSGIDVITSAQSGSPVTDWVVHAKSLFTRS